MSTFTIYNMTMHLESPRLTMTGKKRGKQKFRNADEVRLKRELAESWNAKQNEWRAMSKPIKKPFTVKLHTMLPKVPPGRETPKIPSVDSKIVGAVNVKQTQHYTGENLLGVSIMHKSCLQPIFKKEEAIDAASMRR